MSTTTTNYGLIKPDTTDPILIGQLNDNADAVDAALKENADAIENKPDAADIPTPSTAAPAMDGTAAAGTSTNYARADHVHPSDTSKQDALTAAQLAAVNSGIDSAKVEQIETNKNNILLIEQMNGAKNCIVLKPITQWNIPSGVTITQNDEGAYIFNGTVSSGYKYIAIGIFYYTSQTYHIHRSIISGGGYIYTNDNTLNSNAGNEYTYATSGSTTVYLRIGNSSKSVTFDNDMLSPMIITDAAYDAGFTDYQPYAMSNVELTAAIQALQAQLANQ